MATRIGRSSDSTAPPFRLTIAGGGTGGHVYPGLTVAAAARRARPLELLWIGTRGGMEEELVGRAGVAFASVAAAQIRGRSPLGMLGGGAAIVAGVAQAAGHLRRFRPRVVLATGGYVCVPVVVAAKLLGLPTMVYLPDVEPGLAVAALRRIVDRIAASTDASRPFLPAHKLVVTGYPVREDIRGRTRAAARAALGLEPDLPVIAVLGGSRGARTINAAIAEGLPRLLAVAQVVHAGGTDNHTELEHARAGLPPALRDRYRLYAYLHEELPDALAASDLVVARAGASVLGEYPAAGLPSVLVPYPHAGAHQHHNARFLADRGAAVVVENADAARGALVERILTLLADRPQLERLAAATRQLDRPDAAAAIAREVFHLGERADSPRR